MSAVTDSFPTDKTALYAAAKSNDTRFDGRIYIAVTSTGIYCRPVCSVRMPKFENCEFYRLPAQAELAGFRPCLVCRPELAPGDARVDAPSKLARLAARRIEDGALDDGSVDDLASEFGVTARHLRRAMIHEVGVSPIELAQTQRLLNAKQLLSETSMPITDVALASGFESVRRFNALFRSRYRLNPTELRKNVAARRRQTPRAELDGMRFRIDYRPPMNWERLSAFLGARAIPGVEAVIDDAYVRTATAGDRSGWVMVQPLISSRRVRPVNALSVTVSASLSAAAVIVVNRVKTVFDTRADVAAIEATLSRDPLLAPIIKQHSGMRLPGAFDGFELLLRAILGQQVSVKGATTLAGRMANRFGEPIETPWDELNRLTPSAARIARARVATIAKIGMPQRRAACIKHVAQAVNRGEISLSPGVDPEIVARRLVEIPGIGDWTASYIAMRALAWPDALPAGDLGVQKALETRRVADVEARAEQWRPWRAYAAIYLWLKLSGG